MNAITPAEAVLRQMSSLWYEKRDLYHDFYVDTGNGEWLACYFAASRVARAFEQTENELFGKLSRADMRKNHFAIWVGREIH